MLPPPPGLSTSPSMSRQPSRKTPGPSPAASCLLSAPPSNQRSRISHHPVPTLYPMSSVSPGQTSVCRDSVLVVPQPPPAIHRNSMNITYCYFSTHRSRMQGCGSTAHDNHSSAGPTRPGHPRPHTCQIQGRGSDLSVSGPYARMTQRLVQLLWVRFRYRPTFFHLYFS